MVYCGKPSRGCQMCRTRRIKCDETKPTCLQCQKSRRQCPGYKDDFDLVFRNETQATERRAKRATTASKKAITTIAQARQRQQQMTGLQFPPDHSGRAMSISSNWSDSSATNLVFPRSANSDRSSLVVAASSVPGQLNTSFEAQAVHFFLSNWVLLPKQGTNRGYFDFLLPLLRTSPPDSHMSLTFAATALAALANRSSPGVNSKGLLPYAAQKYEKALKRTNEALRDPVLAKQDSTLASVLLLGLFEQITSCRSNLMGWGSHVDGAVALIRMRGKKQLRTAVGKGLFITVRTQMVVNCTSSSKPPHMGIEFWTTDAMKDHYGQESTRLHLAVTELRAEVNKTMTMAPKTAANLDKVIGYIRKAQIMVEKYERWMTTLPQEWVPRVASWDGDGRPEGGEREWEVYPGEVQSFQDMWQASVWAMTYVHQLVLSGLLVRCSAWIYSPLDYRNTPEYESAASLACRMIAKVIATIPYLLGWGLRDSLGRKQPQPVDTGEFAVGGGGFGAQSAVPRSLGGFFALWPLFNVSSSDYADDSQRRWASGRLRWITEEMGVNQAGVLSQFQLRLPSMVIKRDGMGISSPSARDMSKYVGPTGNLPAPARPVTVEKVMRGSTSTNIKVDEESLQGSETNSKVVGNLPLVNGGLTSNSLDFGVESQQTQHQNMDRQRRMVSKEQGPSVSHQQRGNNEPASRYASQQAYSTTEDQTQIPNQNLSLYPRPSPLHPPSQNQQFQYQNQGQLSSQGSYHHILNSESPHIISTHTMNIDTHQSNLTVPNSNQYNQVETQPSQSHLNQLDPASRIDNFVNEMTSRCECQSFSHSSSCSPTNTYDGSSPLTPQSSSSSNNHLSPQYHFNSSSNTLQAQYSYQSNNSNLTTSNSYNYNNNNNNDVVFKVEDSSTLTPTTSMSGLAQWNTINNHQTPTLNQTTSDSSINTSDNTSMRSTARDPRTSATSNISTGGSYDYTNNRLDWEIEMVNKEATKGNELERRHFQAHMRELERQRMTDE